MHVSSVQKKIASFLCLYAERYILQYYFILNIESDETEEKENEIFMISKEFF